MVTRLGLGLIRVGWLRRRVPLSVTLELTHRCVARCSYCANVRDPCPEMDTREVLDLMDELRTAGLARLGLTGGEALLRDDLPDIIAHAVRLGLYVTVNSNGMLVRSMGSRMRGAHALVLSLNGARASHEATKEGTRHDEVLAAIAWARERRMDLLTITTLTRENVEDVPVVLETARRMRFWCTFQPVVRCGTQARLPDGIALDDQDLWRVGDLLLRARASGYPVANTPRHLRALREAARPRRARPCPLAAGACTIRPDGTVVPCQVVSPDAGFLNGRRVGFARAFREMPVPACDAFCPGPYQELADLFALRPDSLANAARIEAARRLERFGMVA